VIATGLVTLSLGFSIGCSNGPSADEIAKEIQQKISTDPDTKDSQVTVAAKDGKVTLSGIVQSNAAQAANAAENCGRAFSRQFTRSRQLLLNHCGP
jgi:hypothetical protein